MSPASFLFLGLMTFTLFAYHCEGAKVCPIPVGVGICLEECSSDSDCSGKQMCCSNGCGHTCQAPCRAQPFTHQCQRLDRKGCARWFNPCKGNPCGPGTLCKKAVIPFCVKTPCFPTCTPACIAE